MNAGEIALTLGGARRSGAQWVARCPAHGDRTPSLSLRDADDGRVLVHCHAGCAPQAILHVLRQRGLLGRLEPAQSQTSPSIKAEPKRKPGALFTTFLPIGGSPVERYLRARVEGVVVPSADVLRYAPAHPPRFPWPSMVALVTSLADARTVQTLHFTDLHPDGSEKAPIAPNKRTLKGYPMKGGVVRLTDDADVTLRVGVAEGIEKALAISTSFMREQGRVEHVWSALNAGNMAQLPVLPGIETLAIYSDKNGVGKNAAHRLALRWHHAGRRVELGASPGPDWDEYDGR
jgi:hypothetical protein